MTLHAFSRTEMLIGNDGLNELKNKKVAIFGIGGVGTFVAEGLARSGVGNFVLIDDDDICVTNINRQIHATISTVGKSKVDVMKDRILDINPGAEIKIYQKLYNSESADELLCSSYDYVIDAIDMVSSKLHLIEICNEMNIPIISAMGAGNKINPTKFEVSDIYKTSICPLARVMRKELKKRGIEKLKVVYSKELPLTPEGDTSSGVRRSTPGSISFVPSVAGLIIAAEVVKDFLNLE